MSQISPEYRTTLEAMLLSENERERRHARAVLDGKLVALPAVELPVALPPTNRTGPTPDPISVRQAVERKAVQLPQREYRSIDPHTIITAERLATDTVALVAELPPDIDLVCAVARSGLMPGGLIASMLHLPLRTVSRRHGLAEPGHGGRLAPDFHDPTSVLPEVSPKHVLLIDDTAAMGREMRDCPRRITERWPDAAITRAVVYCHPQAIGQVDLIHSLYPGQHYLTWNWPSSGHGEHMVFDWDGILGAECPVEDDDDGPRYRHFLATAKPLYLPRRKPAAMIVSARHEKYRGLCLEWLARHRLQVGKLVLRDWDYDPARSHDEQVGEWKAGAFGATNFTIFAESSPTQAAIINRITGRRVLCPAMGRVLPAIPLPVAQADPWLPLIRACDDYNPACCSQPAPFCTRFNISPSREKCIECLTGRGITPG